MLANGAGMAYTDHIHLHAIEPLASAKEGHALIHKPDLESTSRPARAAWSGEMAVWDPVLVADDDTLSIPHGTPVAANGRGLGPERVTRWMREWVRRLWTRLRDSWNGHDGDDFDELDVTGWCAPADA